MVIGADLNTHNHGIARLSRKMTGGEQFSGWGKTEASWWDDQVFIDTGLCDPFAKDDDSHNTWIKAGPLTVWGGKIDRLLYSTANLELIDEKISEGNKSSDHPFLRVDLLRKSQSEAESEATRVTEV